VSVAFVAFYQTATRTPDCAQAAATAPLEFTNQELPCQE
jgi:hypothetical protein